MSTFCRRDPVELSLSRFFAIAGNFSFDFFAAVVVATEKTSFCSSLDARGGDPVFDKNNKTDRSLFQIQANRCLAVVFVVLVVWMEMKMMSHYPYHSIDQLRLQKEE